MYTKVIKPGESEGEPRVFTVVGVADNSVIGRDGPTPA